MKELDLWDQCPRKVIMIKEKFPSNARKSQEPGEPWRTIPTSVRNNQLGRTSSREEHSRAVPGHLVDPRKYPSRAYRGRGGPSRWQCRSRRRRCHLAAVDRRGWCAPWRRSSSWPSKAPRRSGSPPLGTLGAPLSVPPRSPHEVVSRSADERSTPRLVPSCCWWGFCGEVKISEGRWV